MSDQQSVLFYDIETLPLLALVWGPKTEYIGAHQFENDVCVVSWAAKWAGGKRVHGGVLTRDEALARKDRRIVGSLADMMRSADLTVAHNGDKFDIKKVNTRLLLNGQEPLSPGRTIDTLTLARRTLSLASNKLDYLADVLGVGRKIPTDFELWRSCTEGNTRALAEMYRYNREDVRLLEDVFEGLRPYVRGLPRMVDAEYDGEWACTRCGSASLQARGTYRTNAGSFQRYRCNDCGRWDRSRKGTVEPRLATVPLP